MLRYILKGRTPVLCDDLLVWGAWVEVADRRVAITRLGRYTISTIFLGIDYCFYGKSSPILFETMVFGDRAKYGEIQVRYHTWEEAESGHGAIVAMVKLDRIRENRRAFRLMCSRLGQ